VASYGPPDTLMTDNGPQLASTLFQGVCRLMGITNLYSTTYHHQTQGQVVAAWPHGGHLDLTADGANKWRSHRRTRRWGGSCPKLA